MKHQLLRPLFVAVLAAAFAFTVPGVRAEDKKDKAPQKEEKKDDAPEEEEAPDEDALPDLEEFKKRSKEEEKESNEIIRKMLRVFIPLEGEWTGTEEVKHSDPRYKALDKSWKDEWKGFFTMERRYFEMTGSTQGEDPTAYRWICTWDVKEEAYRAWYFGETGQTVYTGKLSDDGKYVIWTTESEDSGSQTRFSMIPDGDRMKCSGTDRMGGRIWAKQSSSYTRKRVEI